MRLESRGLGLGLEELVARVGEDERDEEGGALRRKITLGLRAEARREEAAAAARRVALRLVAVRRGRRPRAGAPHALS